VLIAALHDDDVVRTNLSIHLALAAQSLTGFGSTVLVDGARLATLDAAAVDHAPGATLRDITESARWTATDKDISIGSITLAMGRKTTQLPLVSGMRSAASWLTLTEEVADVAISRLCDIFGASVVTSEASLDGRRESGSLDIEERNVLPRLLARCADVLVVATRANPIAIQRWRETMSTVTALRSDQQPVVSVVIDAPKNPATRASIQSALVNSTDRPVTVTFDDVGLSKWRRNDVGMVDGSSITKLGGVLDAVLRDLVERPTRGQDASDNAASSAQSA
jgi:hypothetical protein